MILILVFIFYEKNIYFTILFVIKKLFLFLIRLELTWINIIIEFIIFF